MAAIFTTLKDIDLKRQVAHIFPGFLLFAGLVMAFDASVPSTQSTVTSLVLNVGKNVEPITTIILIGLFVGSILGIMIDGLGHWLFEHKLFHYSLSDIEKREKIAFSYYMTKLRMRDLLREPSSYYLYPKLGLDPFNKDTLGAVKDLLIREFYSYYEFYVNSAIALLISSFIIPYYMINVLNTSWLSAVTGFLVVLILAMLLFRSALHTLKDYRENRIAMIEGKLKTEVQPTGEKPAVAKPATEKAL